MRRHEALEAAIEECRKLGKKYRLEQCKTGNHWKMYIDGVKRVIIISDTFALKIVRRDIRKAIGGQ